MNPKYQAITIRNFRGFKHLSVAPLGQINLIAGANNVGKTALLEALWLLYGYLNPELGLKLERFRGIQSVRSSEFLHNLFRGFDPAHEIELSSILDDGNAHTLRITASRGRTSTASLNGTPGMTTPDSSMSDGELSNSESTGAVLSEVLFECLERGTLAKALISGDEVKYEHGETEPDSTAVFLSAMQRTSPVELAERYGQIEVLKEADRVVQLLARLEPRLRKLSLVQRGGIPMMFGDIGQERLVPFSLMGEGLSRVLQIAIAFPTARDGLLLVDEVENGLYHEVLPEVWKSILDFADAYNVQFFATTHSEECIHAAYEALQSAPAGTLVVHRLEHGKEGVRAVSIDMESLGAALEMRGEIR